MPEFKAYWSNYIDFSDRTTARGYWIPALILFVINGLLSILGKPADGNYGLFDVISSLFSLACFIPSLAITVRRLRDTGRKWTWIFICLIPIVGWIWFIVLLCKASVPDDGTPVV